MGVLNVVMAIVVLIVAVWVAIFGGVGALLSRARGSSAAAGLAWGTLLGPFGWLAILWITRGLTPRRHGGLAIPPTPGSTTTVDPWDD